MITRESVQETIESIILLPQWKVKLISVPEETQNLSVIGVVLKELVQPPSSKIVEDVAKAFAIESIQVLWFEILRHACKREERVELSVSGLPALRERESMMFSDFSAHVGLTDTEMISFLTKFMRELRYQHQAEMEGEGVELEGLGMLRCIPDETNLRYELIPN